LWFFSSDIYAFLNRNRPVLFLLKRQSACFTRVKPWVQTLVPQKERNSKNRNNVFCHTTGPVSLSCNNLDNSYHVQSPTQLLCNISFQPILPQKEEKNKGKISILLLTCNKYFCVQKGKTKCQKFKPQVHGHIWKSAESLRNSMRVLLKAKEWLSL
jgi:hypothetical protein